MVKHPLSPTHRHAPIFPSVPAFSPQALLAERVQSRLNLSISGIHLDWDAGVVGESLRLSSASYSGAMSQGGRPSSGRPSGGRPSTGSGPSGGRPAGNGSPFEAMASGRPPARVDGGEYVMEDATLGRLAVDSRPRRPRLAPVRHASFSISVSIYI